MASFRIAPDRWEEVGFSLGIIGNDWDFGEKFSLAEYRAGSPCRAFSRVHSPLPTKLDLGRGRRPGSSVSFCGLARPRPGGRTCSMRAHVIGPLAISRALERFLSKSESGPRQFSF